MTAPETFVSPPVTHTGTDGDEKPRRHTARNIALALAVVAAVFVAVLATREPAEVRLADSPLLGKAAPAFSGTSVLADATHIRSADLRDKWVVLNFFASWCTPCKQEHPEIQRFAATHRDDAQVIGVIWNDSAANTRRFFEREGGDWPVIRDPGVQIGLDYGVRGPPESYVIDPAGRVVAKYTGPLTAASLEDLLAGGDGSDA